MTDHFDFNFGKPTTLSATRRFDNVLEFPIVPRDEGSGQSVFVLSEEYRVPGETALKGR